MIFRVYYERPMMTDILNLKLRQIARFALNLILDEIRIKFDFGRDVIC